MIVQLCLALMWMESQQYIQVLYYNCSIGITNFYYIGHIFFNDDTLYGKNQILQVSNNFHSSFRQPFNVYWIKILLTHNHFKNHFNFKLSLPSSFYCEVLILGDTGHIGDTCIIVTCTSTQCYNILYSTLLYFTLLYCCIV